MACITPTVMQAPAATHQAFCPIKPSQKVRASRARDNLRRHQVADILIVPLRRVVWKVEQGFVDADPFDGQHWGKAGTEIDSKAWTPWDDIYDGERPALLTRIGSASRLLIQYSEQVPGSKSRPTKRWAYPQGCRFRTSPSKQEDRGKRVGTDFLPPSITRFTVWYVVRAHGHVSRTV